MTELQEKIEKIVSGHRRGLRDRMQTVQLLASFYAQTEAVSRDDFCEYIVYLLRTEPVGTRPVSGIGVNIPAVAIMMLAHSCQTTHLPDLIFQRLQLDDSQAMMDWASELCPAYEYCLFTHTDRFENHTLDRTRELSKNVLATDQAVPISLVEVLGRLTKSVERIEFDRFEKSLIQSRPGARSPADELTELLSDLNLDTKISEAMRVADNYLRGGGEFKETIAAGLLRSSIDVTHRAIVSRIESLKKMPYKGADKDADRRAYLFDAGFITAPEKQFFACIYTLISQEASHKLIAPKETVLVLQTTTNNYLLLLLRRLSEFVRANP